jgi:hypothetical protein
VRRPVAGPAGTAAGGAEAAEDGAAQVTSIAYGPGSGTTTDSRAPPGTAVTVDGPSPEPVTSGAAQRAGTHRSAGTPGRSAWPVRDRRPLGMSAWIDVNVPGAARG